MKTDETMICPRGCGRDAVARVDYNTNTSHPNALARADGPSPGYYMLGAWVEDLCAEHALAVSELPELVVINDVTFHSEMADFGQLDGAWAHRGSRRSFESAAPALRELLLA